MSSSTPRDLATIFLDFSRQKLLSQYWPRLRACVESLTDEQVWWRPNPTSNSIANLMLHLNGNVTQWLIASFDHLNDLRDRPAEFNQTEALTRAELVGTLGSTIDRAATVLARLTEHDLTGQFEIQGYHVTGMDAVYQVVEHFGLHYGQIAYITKMLRDQDLGFYRELSETGRITPQNASHP